MIDKFAGYGFNKSHAAGYALVAYQTAWLKTHHRPEFYAASMSFDIAPDRQAAPCSSRTCAAAGSTACRLHQRQRRALRGRGRRRSATRSARSRASARKRWRRWSPSASATAPFASLDDFAARIDPRLLNRRQLESLAAAGAFDSLVPDRAAVFAAAETILAHAASAADQRDERAGRPVRRRGRRRHRADPPAARREWTWPQRMAAERDAFGFYFSAHPVDAHAHLLAAHKVRSFAELASLPMPADGSRTTATMAALVEGDRWRTSAKGRRYHDGDAQRSHRASSSPPPSTTSRCAALEAAAKSGTCGLMTVELDRRPGDEVPRVAIKRFQPLEALAKRTRLQMTVRVADAAAGGAARRRARRRRGGNGVVRLLVPLGRRRARR